MDKDVRYDVLFVDDELLPPVEQTGPPTAVAPGVYFLPGQSQQQLIQPFHVYRPVTVHQMRIWSRGLAEAAFFIVKLYQNLDALPLWISEWTQTNVGAAWTPHDLAAHWQLLPGCYFLEVFLRSSGEWPFVAELGASNKQTQLPLYHAPNPEVAPYPHGIRTELSLAFNLAIGPKSQEELPLLLAEQAGAMAFYVNAAPPITGKLVQGDLQESDLSQAWTVRTQNDWRGGRGQDVAYGVTDRYADGLADTRFPNQVILPPAPRLDSVGGGGVGFTPNDGVTSTVEVEAISASGSVLVGVPDFVDTAAGVQSQTGMKNNKVPDARWMATAVAEHVKNVQPAAGQSPGGHVASLEYDVVSNSPPNVQSDALSNGYGYWDKPEWLLVAVVLHHGESCAAMIRTGASGLLLNGQRLSTVKVRLWGGQAGPYFLNFRLCRSTGGTTPMPDHTATVVIADRTLHLNNSWTDYEIDFPPQELDPFTTYWWVVNLSSGGYVMVASYCIGPGGSAPNGYIALKGPYQDWRAEHYRALWYKFLWGPEFQYLNRRGADIAQSFLPAQQIDVRRVSINARQKGAWRGDLAWSVELQADNNGAPSGTPLPGCRWVKPATLTTAYQTLTLAPAQSTSLTPNARYWLVVKVAGESANGTAGEIAGAVEVECDNAGRYVDGAAWQRALINQEFEPWQQQARDWYFHVGNLERVCTRLAQSFLLPNADGLGGLDAIQVTQCRVRVTSYMQSGAGVVQIKLCADNAGEPGMLLAHGSIQHDQTTDGWYKASLASAVTLNASTRYWIVAEAVAPTQADACTLNVLADSAKGYAGGVGLLQEGVGDPITWGAWQDGGADMFFQLGTGSPVVWGPYYRTGMAKRQRVAQQFQTGNALSLTHVMMYLRRQAWADSNSPSVTVQLWTNAVAVGQGDMPGAPVSGATGTLTQALLSQTPGWVRVPISAQLQAGTKYWLVLEASGYEVSVMWLGDGGANPQRPAWLCMSNKMTEAGAWDDKWLPWDADLYFMLNDGAAFGLGVTVTPVEYKGEWYVASGQILYRFDRATQQWLSFATLGATITALEVYDGKLWVAMGDAFDLFNWNGSFWNPVYDRRYTHLLAAGGYLNALQASGGPNKLGYFNGTAWTDLACGTPDHAFTGMAWYRDTLIVFSTVEALSHTGHYSVRIIDYRQMQHANNGRRATVWGGMLIYPVRNSLYAWDGSAVHGMGPDLDGMPVGEQGPVSAMVSTPNWLFVAIDAGLNGYSTILAKGRQGGWHKLVRMDVPGQRITSMGYEACTSGSGMPRLHWFAGGNAWHMEMPDVTDNPWGYAGATFRTEGWVESARLLGELAQIDKDIQSVSLRTQGCSARQWVDVYLEVDQSGHWLHCGKVTKSPWQVLELVAPNMAPKSVAVGSTEQVLVISPNQRVDDLWVGQFVRVGSDVRQVDRIDLTGDLAQVILTRPLSAVPAPGTMIVASRPVGREVRYRLVLRASDPQQTPRVEGVSLTYQEMFLDRFRFTLTVRLESAARGRTGAPYLLTPLQLRERMYEWLKRPTPFILIGPDGRRWRVKIVSFSEAGFVRETEQDRLTIGSMMTVNLIEV